MIEKIIDKPIGRYDRGVEYRKKDTGVGIGEVL